MKTPLPSNLRYSVTAACSVSLLSLIFHKLSHFSGDKDKGIRDQDQQVDQGKDQIKFHISPSNNNMELGQERQPYL
jgi:hypothetical protein